VLTGLWVAFWGFLVVLMVVAAVALRMRLRRRLAARRLTVDDDAIREIIHEGTLATDEDEPLDLREIDEEERRFWSEQWDEPEEW